MAKKAKELPKPADELTDKQKQFALRYVVHGNKSRAAVEAGYGTGQPGAQAYQLLQLPKVNTYVAQLRESLNRESGLERVHLIDRILDMLDATVDEVADFSASDLRGEVSKGVMMAVKSVEKKSSLRYGDSIKVEMVDKVALIDRLIDLLGWGSSGKTDDEGESKKYVDAYAEHLAQLRKRITEEGGNDAG